MNRSVMVPPRMAHLPVDRRGYPVFFMAHVDDDGRPHFTINDEHKRQHVIAEDRCSICGGKLLRGRWFVGGELSAFHEQGAYLDPPMHDECVHFALKVCPYLAAPRYGKYIEASTLKPGDPLVTSIDPNVVDERPQVFVTVMATGQKKIMGTIQQGGIAAAFVQYIKPHKPYRRVEYWRHGSEITQAQARTALLAVAT